MIANCDIEIAAAVSCLSNTEKVFWCRVGFPLRGEARALRLDWQLRAKDDRSLRDFKHDCDDTCGLEAQERAAVAHDCLATDVARVRSGEKRHNPADVIGGIADATKWCSRFNRAAQGGNLAKRAG